MTWIANYSFEDSTKPAIICCHISFGLQPHAAMWDIMFRIIPDIKFVIMVGIALVATMTKIPHQSRQVAPKSDKDFVERLFSS